MNDVVKLIDEELKAISDPEKAAGMKSYMKDKFDFLGVASPDRKVIVRFVWQEHKNFIQQNWRTLYDFLWQVNEREYQYVAMDLMQKTKRKLELQDIDLIEKYILQKSWWDTVDFIASHMAGMYFEKFPKQIPVVIPSWIKSDNKWLNRTAILFQLKYKEKLDFNLLKENILCHLGSKEFFINKAAGWALRQHSKVDPQGVKEFIEKTKGLANITIKEGSKYV